MMKRKEEGKDYSERTKDVMEMLTSKCLYIAYQLAYNHQ